MSQLFFNKMARTWDTDGTETDTAKLQQMAGRLQLEPGQTVLDIGTGTGVLIPFLLGKLGPEGLVLGLDYAGKMLEVARKKTWGGPVRFLHADASAIPLDDESVDSVVCYSCFPHFQNKPAAIAECWRVLVPGGRLTIAHTSGRQELNHFHREITEVTRDAIPDNDEMYRLLSAGGFREIVIEDNEADYLSTGRKPSG